MAKKFKKMHGTVQPPQTEMPVKRKRGRPAKSIQKEHTDNADNHESESVNQQPVEPVAEEIVELQETEKMEIPDIEKISPFGGEPVEQTYAMPPETKSDNNLPPQSQKTTETNEPILGSDEQNLSEEPQQGDEFSDKPDDLRGTTGASSMTDEEAKQTYEAIKEQYNFSVGNLLPEIPGLAVKPSKELFQLEEKYQNEFLTYIKNFNEECFGALKINDEDNAMLEEPSIYMIKKQASKITMEDRFKMAILQVGAKKLALLVGIIRQGKSINAQINERIKQAVLEQKASVEKMADMMNQFDGRIKNFEEKEKQFNSEIEDFNRQKREWEESQKTKKEPKTDSDKEAA